MAMLQPYPAMKDSGVEWLGEVPEHWDVRRLGSLGTFSASGIDKNSVEGEPLVRMINYLDVYNNPTHELGANREYMTVSCPDWKRRVHAAKRGDMFFTPSSETVEDIGWSAVAVEDLDNTVYSYHVIRFRPNSAMEVGFQRYWCNARPIRDQFSAACRGTTRQILTRGDFRSILAPVPPILEQGPIARFLHHVDRRIRRHIRAKQKLIGLLEEQKQAIVHRAVTRGLDPDVPLKPSGVEWLGDVPEHWEVRRVKQAAQILRGKFTHRPRNDPSLYDGPYPFIQTGEVARADKMIEGYRQTLNERGLAVSKVFPAGTLVMTIAANIGDVAVLDFEACFPDSIVGFIPRSGVERDYLYYVFRAMKPKLLREAPVNTQGNLNVERIGSMGVALPPAIEQQSVVRKIETSTLGLNAAINRARRQIELLREYRTRLIADVVTGKLDVREAAANLPHEPEEPEPLGETEEIVDESDVSADELDAACHEVHDAKE